MAQHFNNYQSARMKFLTNIFLITLIFAVSACSSENAADSPANKILGRWEIQEASRNGQITESLAQLYYDFAADGKMQTNLSGATESGTYEINDMKLLQKDMQINAEYNIESLSDSLLVLTTKLRNSNFKFILTPKEGE